MGLSLALYLPLLLRGVDRTAVAQTAGFIGLQLIWWQVILGNRVITRFFTRDLVWVNKFHQLAGKYGFFVILLHPVLMISIYGSVVTSLSLSPASRFDQGVSFGRSALVLLAVVWLASALVRTRLSWRWWKRLHLLGYLVLPLLFAHVLLLSPSVSRFPLLKVWLYFLIVSFAGVVLLRLADWAALTKKPYKITGVSPVARKVTRLSMKPLGKSFQPQPGQFAYFQARRFGETHPFTISHFDEKSGEISFSIKALGPYSAELAKLKSGSTVFLDGPYGVFTQEIGTATRPVVAIAGGIGITPFVRWLEKQRINYFFLGCRTEADIAHKKIIDNSGVHAVYALNRERKPGYVPGYITADLVEKSVKEDLPACDFYICGPPPMMEKLQKALVAKGVNPSRIRMEKFSL